MRSRVTFGWRVPGFPVDGSSATDFRDQIYAMLDAIQGHFHSAWVADHFVPWMSTQDQSTPTFECYTSLSYLMARYPGLHFGTIVMSQSYRPPALLAKMTANLQTLSDGRLIVGIGAGWKEDEYLAYGYPFPKASTRIHQLEEAVQILRLMWRQPRATFKGKYYHIQDAICEPKPDPIPPLLIGGGGRQLTLRVVAKYADWWNIGNCSTEEYQETMEVLRQHCQEVGRSFEDILLTYGKECVAVAETEEKARWIAERSPFSHPQWNLVGTPDQVAAQLQPFIDLGVRHVILRFADFPTTAGIELFAKEVLPRF